MDTKQETVNAVLAEMRRFSAFAAARSRMTPAPALAAEQDGHAAKLAEYADRIEAAAERERVKARHDAEIEWTRIGYDERKAEERPGNAAAMREALDKAECVLLVAARFATDDAFDDADARENLRDVDWDGALAEIRAALAAPARNCDRFQTADEARDAVKAAFANTMLLDDRQLRAVCDWLFDPAQEGGAK